MSLSPKRSISGSAVNPSRISARLIRKRIHLRTVMNRCTHGNAQESPVAATSDHTELDTGRSATTSTRYTTAWCMRSQNSPRPSRNAMYTESKFTHVFVNTV